MRRKILVTVAAAALLVACGRADAPETEITANADATAAVNATEGTAPVEAETAGPPFDASAAPAGTYKADPHHAYIIFSYDHMGYSRPQIRWRTWSGDLAWNPDAPEQTSVNVVIDSTTPDSGVDVYDEHLRSADFFNSAEYPQITFKSTSVTPEGPASAKVTGDLTMKGVTKPVTLDVTINRAADDSFANAYKLGFSATGVAKRSDFGVDKYAPMVSDDVALTIEAEFLMPKEAAPEQ